MRWPGVAIAASVLATSIGVDGLVEADVRAIVGGDDRSRSVQSYIGAELPFLTRIFPAVVKVFSDLSLVAARFI